MSTEGSLERETVVQQQYYRWILDGQVCKKKMGSRSAKPVEEAARRSTKKHEETDDPSRAVSSSCQSLSFTFAGQTKC